MKSSMSGRRSYIEAYAAHTDQRVLDDPHEAVGGMWEAIGALQFNFLLAKGLLPTHSMLDLGCGTLRGGRHFIRYLDAGNYTGYDISPVALTYATSLAHDEGISDRKPRLRFNADRDLRFAPFTGETFDFILAQSVFTHLPNNEIVECFQHVGAIMGPSSLFFFTWSDAPDFCRTPPKDFRQPFAFFMEVATANDFRMERCHGFHHPRGQSMAVVSRP